MTTTHTQREIFRFWAPLAATWLMMAAEGPFLAAVIARLADPTFNLAAYGVAFAFALLVESPVIMMMSASIALVEDGDSFRRLRRFAHGLSATMTGVMVILLLPPVFHAVMEGIVALPPEVARRTHLALLILVPWPGAIGYRRFHQGLLIREGRTRLVAYGTVVRLCTMAAMATTLFAVGRLPGAAVGAAALSSGVVAEALATRMMARAAVRRLVASAATADHPLSLGRITRFYYPLALTSIIGLVLQPMLTFFMGRAPSPVESLAVFPVIHALNFVFRALGLSYQEVAIALAGRRFEHAAAVRRFAGTLAVSVSLGFAVIVTTPLARVWFGEVSGLAPALVDFAILPALILIPLPALTGLQSYQRGVLVLARRTAPATWATALEIGIIAVAFPLLTAAFGWTGVVSSGVAFVVGRLAAVGFLAGATAKAVGGTAS
jgi:hypothetical protein